MRAIMYENCMRVIKYRFTKCIVNVSNIDLLNVLQVLLMGVTDAWLLDQPCPVLPTLIFIWDNTSLLGIN